MMRRMLAVRVCWSMVLALFCLLTLAPSLCAKPQPVPSLTGSFRLLTYNIAGLPEGISRSQPSVNVPLIAPLLSHYDIVLIQEDFAYQAELRRGVRQPYRSAPQARRAVLDFGDGLSRFARSPFTEPSRQAWKRCNGYFGSGSDCLTSKGFSLARHQLDGQGEVDIYNLHLDAGRSREDSRARAAQLEQLALAIRQHSEGRAVIVAGDTNLWGRDVALLKVLEAKTGVSDCCHTLSCAEPGRIDRVMFRSSDALELELKSWGIDRRFVDSRERPLSDHLAVAVEFHWRILAPASPSKLRSRMP